MTERGRRRSLVARIRAVGGLVVAVVNSKGGSGKSTLAWHLAHELAGRGLRVLVIETDPQQTLADWAAARIRAMVITVLYWPHDTVAGDLAELAQGYDVVIIDGQARHTTITRSVMAAGIQHPHGVVLIPVPGGGSEAKAARRDMGPLVALARAELRGGREGRIRTVLVNWRAPELATREAIKTLATARICDPTEFGLTRSADYANADNAGLGVSEYNPAGTAAADIRALATEVAEIALTPKTPTR